MTRPGGPTVDYGCQPSRERLALTRCHLGEVAPVECQGAGQLDEERVQSKFPVGGLANRTQGFRQDVIRRRSGMPAKGCAESHQLAVQCVIGQDAPTLGVLVH